MSELYHDAQLPLELSPEQTPKTERPTEVRHCKKCGHKMTIQWDTAPQYNGRWRYRCESCRTKKRRERDPGYAKRYRQRAFERNPNMHKEKYARAKERNPDISKEKSRLERERYPERVKAAQRKIKLSKYGLSEEQYIAMYEQQGGVCAICGKAETGKWLAVDHDHATDQVRALLCGRCNVALGLVEDDAECLRAMADYLAFHRSKSR